MNATCVLFCCWGGPTVPSIVYTRKPASDFRSWKENDFPEWVQSHICNGDAAISNVQLINVYSNFLTFITSMVLGEKWLSCLLVFCENLWAIRTQERRLWIWIQDGYYFSALIRNFECCTTATILYVMGLLRWHHPRPIKYTPFMAMCTVKPWRLHGLFCQTSLRHHTLNCLGFWGTLSFGCLAMLDSTHLSRILSWPQSMP